MDHRHSSFSVGNTLVFFPFEPYEPQRQYISCVIEALSERKHAIIESPTGTGKTLSLLCSSLAWLQNSNSKSVIYYTSRTHMQLGQVAKEMKRTAYARVPAVVIGSRKHMCLNDDVRSQADNLINRACRNAIAKNACAYHTNYEEKLKVMEHNDVHDIEDLEKFGRSHQCCPYYASRKIAETKSSVVFMPYDYLLEVGLQKRDMLKLENSVIIIDEAHNIEDKLKDSVSGTITQICLKTVQESCQRLPEKLHAALNHVKHGLSRSGYDPEEKITTKNSSNKKNQEEKEAKMNIIEELSKDLTNDKLEQVRSCSMVLGQRIHHYVTSKTVFSIELVLSVLDDANIKFNNSTAIIETLESMSSFWSIAGVMSPVLVARYVSAITDLLNVISLVYPKNIKNLDRQNENMKKLNEYYAAHLNGVYEANNGEQNSILKDWELFMWCLYPAIGLKRVFDENCINGPRSIIVTSGTLEPMESIPKDLDFKDKTFKMKSFNHIISDKQLKIMILASSPKPNSFELRSSYASVQQNVSKYSNELGRTLVSLFQVLPFGTLVFFTSYTRMKQVMTVWNDAPHYLKKFKTYGGVYIEKKKQEDFIKDVDKYKETISSGKKAIFFCVCRGKLSEGVNLEGNLCRTVIMTGLPYPNAVDPRIIATRNFRQRKYSDKNGSFWYEQQMRRALNQTIGRVIRNKDDYGMLIFCDPIYSGYKFSVSEWLRRFWPYEAVEFGEVESEVKEFFQGHGINIRQSASESVGAFEVGYTRRPNDNAIGGTTSSRVSQQSTNLFRESTRVQSLAPKSMIANYSVDNDTLTRLKNRSLPVVEEESHTAKRPRTVEDIYEFNPLNHKQTLHNPTTASQTSHSSTCRPERQQNGAITCADQTNSKVSISSNTAQVHSIPESQQSIEPFDPIQGQNYVPKPPPKSLNIFKKKTKRPKQTERKVTQPLDALNIRLVD